MRGMPSIEWRCTGVYTHTGCDGFTAPYLFVKVPLHQYSSLMEEEESGIQGVGQHLR